MSHLEHASGFAGKDAVEIARKGFQALFSAARKDYLAILSEFRGVSRTRKVQRARDRLYREIKNARREGRHDIQQAQADADRLEGLRKSL